MPWQVQWRYTDINTDTNTDTNAMRMGIFVECGTFLEIYLLHSGPHWYRFYNGPISDEANLKNMGNIKW